MRLCIKPLNCLPMYPSVNLTACLVMHICVNVSLHLCISVSMYLLWHLNIYASTYVSIYVSMIYEITYQSIHAFISTCVFVLNVYLCIYVSYMRGSMSSAQHKTVLNCEAYLYLKYPRLHSGSDAVWRPQAADLMSFSTALVSRRVYTTSGHSRLHEHVRRTFIPAQTQGSFGAWICLACIHA